MLFIFRQNLSSSTDVTDKLVLTSRKYTRLCSPYIFSTYLHKNKYFHLVTKNKKIYFIKKTAFNEIYSPVERSVKNSD